MVAGLVPPLVFAGFVAWQLRPAALTSGDGRSGFALAADAECDRTTKRLDDLARKEVNDPSEFAAKAVAIVRESVAAMRKLKPPRNVRVQATRSWTGSRKPLTSPMRHGRRLTPETLSGSS